MVAYSIIIPHKNAPDLLQRCLDSIPKQENIQIIIVDDNSDPSLVDFAAFPGLYDSYTEVYFTKEGKGAGYARNVGLEKVKGKWILFADSDDFFASEFLQLLNKYNDSPYDIVFFSTLSVLSDDITQKAERNYNNKRINDYLDNPTTDTEANLKYGFSEPWAKMIRASLIFENNICFEETIISNDFWFSVNIAYVSKTICAERSPIYTVTYRKESLSMSELSFDKIKTRILVNNKVYTFFKKNNIPIVRDDFRITMLSLLKHKPVYFFRICVELVKENKKNIFNIADSFLIIPSLIRKKKI